MTPSYNYLGGGRGWGVAVYKNTEFQKHKILKFYIGLKNQIVFGSGGAHL